MCENNTPESSHSGCLGRKVNTTSLEANYSIQYLHCSMAILTWSLEADGRAAVTEDRLEHWRTQFWRTWKKFCCCSDAEKLQIWKRFLPLCICLVCWVAEWCNKGCNWLSLTVNWDYAFFLLFFLLRLQIHRYIPLIQFAFHLFLLSVLEDWKSTYAAIGCRVSYRKWLLTINELSWKYEYVTVQSVNLAENLCPRDSLAKERTLLCYPLSLYIF